MKTLYISDLDGTLLNQNAELSEYTAKALNRMIDNGLNFSVATARTAATCNRILGKLHLNTPIILMNGVLVYDFQKKKYIKKELLTQEQVTKILFAMNKIGQTALMYGLRNEELMTYYEYIPNDAVKQFVDERVTKYGKKFIKLNSLLEVNTDIIYFCFINTERNIHLLYDELKFISGLRIEKYQDIYSNGDVWYMEVFASTASKYNAIHFLRNEYKFNWIVAFGDNLNDIPMFEASDECYAVANAKDAVKANANSVIGKNIDDGVVKWLESNMKFYK